MDAQNNEQEQHQVLAEKKDSLSFLNNFFNTSNKYLLIILILAILSFGSGTYLLSQFSTKKQLSQNSPQVNPIPSINIVLSPTPQLIASSSPSITITPTLVSTFTPTPTPDPIASWSAYVSTTSAYSINYPPDWIAKATLQQDPKILEYVVFNPNSATTSALSITISYSTRTYLEALALRDQNGDVITIATVSGIKTTEEDSDGNVSIHAVFPVKKNSIDLYSQQKYKDIFDKMLKTLKLN